MAVLYHYCSNAAFLSIISTHKIYASEFTLSNDILEGKWIREVVQRYCNEKNVSFYNANTIIEEVDKLTSFLGAAGICLSQEGDLLSQWRAYSTNGSGVSIGFDQSCFGVDGSPLPSLQQIIYEPTDQKKLIQNRMDRAIELVGKGAIGSGRIRSLLETAGQSEHDKREKQALDREFLVEIFALFPHFYILKNPAFQEEREWRSVTLIIPQNNVNPDAESEGSGWYLNQMDFRALADRIVPHKEFSLDNNLGSSVICEVILGPRNVTPVRVVEAALLHHGWKGVPVRKSTASYR
jgi:ribosomal protein S16